MNTISQDRASIPVLELPANQALRDTYIVGEFLVSAYRTDRQALLEIAPDQTRYAEPGDWIVSFGARHRTIIDNEAFQKIFSRAER